MKTEIQELITISQIRTGAIQILTDQVIINQIIVQVQTTLTDQIQIQTDLTVVHIRGLRVTVVLTTVAGIQVITDRVQVQTDQVTKAEDQVPVQVQVQVQGLSLVQYLRFPSRERFVVLLKIQISS